MARHVITTFLRDTTNPMVRHHLDSYSDFLDTKIPRFVQAMNPFKRSLEDGRQIRIYIGGKAGDKITYVSPVDEEGIAILPHACRLENKTYTFEIRANIDVEYDYGDEVQTKSFEDILIGRIPLLLKSSICYLRPMTPDQLYEAGECRFELGGYFVISGQERVLLTQESLGSNMFYAKKRIEMPSAEQVRTRTEKEVKAMIDSATKENKYQFIAGIYSESEDGTRRGGHMLVIPPENKVMTDSLKISKSSDYAEFSTSRLATIQIPGFDNPVPLISVFYALGFTSDQDIYDVVLAGVRERTIYDTLFAQLILSHEKYLASEMAKQDDQTQDGNLLFLKRQTRTRSIGAVYTNLYSSLFPHCEVLEESASSFYSRKAYLLGHMLRMAMDVALGITPDSDRDHFRFKRLDASGDLCFGEFRRIYKEVGANMLLELDRRVEFEKQTYKGKNLTNLIQEEGIRNFYWKSYSFLNQFEKSFKGTWNKESGVAQVLSRFSYLGTIAHLRRVNLKMDKESKQREPRRLHSSSWGLMCPIDNPDGRSIGMIKSLTLFSKLTTQSSSADLRDLVLDLPNTRNISVIHPSSWDPLWTKIFLNSDLLGVILDDAESFHATMIRLRREGKIHKFVSLTWHRMDNLYLIQCDAGRPCRVIYREGTKLESVRSAKSWESIVKHMDYIDSQEAECLRISMEPFDPEKPSEIHGSTLFSATGSAMPFTDHNQAPRNMFTCQQVKQACSWYNTAFNKRFDTIATHLHTPQQPLCQTWAYQGVLGGGCIPFGENAIVAIAIYGGYNQEDSVLINESALKRGMYKTSYYHSYDHSENIIDPAAQTHTMIANVVTDPKYRETVNRKDGKDYDKLDADGIIRQGSEVTEDTVLLGMITPKTNAAGQVIAYMDSSILPKRGQTGMVDAVYRYSTSEGLQGVKIRIVENREPVLGDKFGSRHGQKGTVGLRIPEEDMPATADGLRPDLIINPHALPSRMTIGQFLEGMSSKLAVNLGAIVDGTAFSTNQRIVDTKEALIQMGYHPYGNELLYNGMSGEMMEAEIFMGPTYYQRFKHMVEDKINYRSTGPRTLLTHQPLEGRANDGGLRIGEMERDSLIAHGVSNFLNESMMLRSDAHEFLFQPETGLLDANPDYPIEKVNMPYSMGLFLNEIQSLHIQVKLSS